MVPNWTMYRTKSEAQKAMRAAADQIPKGMFKGRVTSRTLMKGRRGYSWKLSFSEKEFSIEIIPVPGKERSGEVMICPSFADGHVDEETAEAIAGVRYGSDVRDTLSKTLIVLFAHHFELMTKHSDRLDQVAQVARKLVLSS